VKIRPLIISTIVTIILFSAARLLLDFDMIQMFVGGLIGYAVLIIYAECRKRCDQL